MNSVVTNENPADTVKVHPQPIWVGRVRPTFLILHRLDNLDNEV